MGKKSVIVGVIITLLILTGLGWGYFQVQTDILKITILSCAAGVVMIGIFTILILTSTKNKLRKLLQELEHLILQESADTLKSRYVQAYNFYLKLSEKNKSNFYGRITKLREKMEQQLKAAKKVEELLEKSTMTNISLLRKQYEEMYAYFRKLPASVQQKYYPQIMHVKEVLEKGR